jgi:phage protein D
MLFTKIKTFPPISTAAVARVVADVDGTSLTDSAEGVSVSKVEATHEIGRPGSFVVETNDLTADNLEWIDSSAVQEGAPIKIAMGWTEKGDPVFAGEVLGLELEVSSTSAPRIAIRGYDRLHRLARARKSRAFVKKRDSEIAEDLAREHGMRLDAPRTPVVHPYVMQADQTDLAFLRARAHHLGFVLRVEDKLLTFAPRDLAADPTATATLGENLLDFFVRTSNLALVGAVEARGWDPAAQKALVGKANKVAKLMGGRTAGLTLADDSFGAQISSAPGAPIVVAADASSAANAELEAMALEHITCEGKMIGAPALRPGHILGVAGVGNRFSGNYWLTRVTHRFDFDGFTTSFEGRRTAS